MSIQQMEFAPSKMLTHGQKNAWDWMRKRRSGFDFYSPAFREAYFEDVHHPLEDQGVDFWWD